MVKNETKTLNNGVLIPAIGLGTWQSSKEDCYNSVRYALASGYTHIDTALIYENEDAVAKAIKDSGIPREKLFITTKLPADVKTFEGTVEAFEKSLANLNTDYIDLYLIHAPWPWSDQGGEYTSGNIEAWKAMIELYNQKKIRAIGVSNFHKKDIIPLIEATGVAPAVNQIRFFIGNTQEEITRYCQENGILIEAYSPMATGELLGRPEIDVMAEKYHVSKAQLSIRYCIERGAVPLPKSVHEARVIQNIDVDFTIDNEDMKTLNALYHIASTRKYRD